MNENADISSIKCKSICIACLRSTNDLSPMTLEFKNEYNKFVEMMIEDCDMVICNVCCCRFRRCLRFKQQCQTARSLLNNAAKDFKLLNLEKLPLCSNLQTSKTEVHFIEDTYNKSEKNLVKSTVNNVNGSQRNLENHILSNSLSNSLCDAKVNTFSENQQFHSFIDSSVNGSLRNNWENNSLTNLNSEQVNSLSHDTSSLQCSENGSLVTNQINGSMNSQRINSSELILDDGFDSTGFNNDDEVPLVMLKERKTKKRKKRKNMVQENEELPEPLTNEAMPSKKVKKELKEGFSSRMVQETDEYTVIKLTREQVLQEMEERSKTEVYMQSPFKCEKCIKGFNFEDVLTSHMEKHSVEIGPFQCDMCTQYCRSAVSLRGHIKSHTTRYKCKLCGVVRLSRQHLLEHHAITHTRQPAAYRCNTCAFNTNKRTVMQRHVKSHTTATPHACDKCGKLFKSIDSLRVHTMRHDKSSRLQCNHCGVSFVYRSLLRRHVTRAHERREYYCVECDAQFKSNESLRLHFKKAKKHRDTSTYKHICAQCPLRFFSAGALCAHRSAAHGEPRAHSCGACRRLYSSRDALRAHVWRVHSQRDIAKAS